MSLFCFFLGGGSGMAEFSWFSVGFGVVWVGMRIGSLCGVSGERVLEMVSGGVGGDCCGLGCGELSI